MSPQFQHPPLGVIEGFYGESWPSAQRLAYADFLAQHQFQFYIYAPKSDSHLRKNWTQPWPQAEAKAMHYLSQRYQSRGLQFGLGLSPFELYQDFSAAARQQLHTKLKELNAYQPDILCLLFDDMRGDTPDLARRQIEICHFVAEHSDAQRLIFCPTYYSFDPVLNKVFGQQPPDYWADLGAGLDPKIDLFWTGSQVCSRHYAAPDLDPVIDLLQRPLFLWDNYPVNDGAKISRFLHLRSFDHDPSILSPRLSGHAVNPMNQSGLSRISLASLPLNYHQPTTDTDARLLDLCQQLCGAELGEQIYQDTPVFQDQGLDQISKDQKKRLIKTYQGFDSPYATEVLRWLQEGYRFDPACLTD